MYSVCPPTSAFGKFTASSRTSRKVNEYSKDRSQNTEKDILDIMQTLVLDNKVKKEGDLNGEAIYKRGKPRSFFLD